MDVFQAMREMRAMRHLKPDPVPRDVIREVIECATHAPTGGNTQNWRFVVVTDPEKRRKLGEIYRDGVDWYVTKVNTAPLPHQTEEQWRRLVAAVRWQGDHVAEAPVLIFPCLKGISPAATANPQFGRTVGASIYPAVQNLLLACRAKGLGATLTSLHVRRDAEVNAILGLPEDAMTFAMIPIGYPTGNFGPTRRLPVDDVIGWDGWE